MAVRMSRHDIRRYVRAGDATNLFSVFASAEVPRVSQHSVFTTFITEIHSKIYALSTNEE